MKIIRCCRSGSLSLSLSLVVYSVPLGEKPAPLGVGFFHREITTSLKP